MVKIAQPPYLICESVNVSSERVCNDEAVPANASYYLVSTLAGKLASRLWQESPLESWHNRSNLMKTARANEPVIARLPDSTKMQPYRCPLSQVDNARDAHVRRKPGSPSCLTPSTFTYSLQICASTAHHAWWLLALHVGPFLKYIWQAFTSLSPLLCALPRSLCNSLPYLFLFSCSRYRKWAINRAQASSTRASRALSEGVPRY
jgi:hypothetical protein